MNEEIKTYLQEYCKKMGYAYSDDEIKEILLYENQVYREEISKHRWYTEYFYVVNVDGKLLGYTWAETTGDNSMDDMGYEFDLSSVCEVEKKEKVVIYYSPIK